MTLIESPALAADRHARTNPLWLVQAELLKVRTTNTWRWFLLGVALFTGQALLRNGVTHHYELNPPLDGMDAHDRAQAVAQAAHAHTDAGHAAITADMLTSGQFVGALLTMLLAVLVVTGESVHHTAIATFLVSPHRVLVTAAKLVAATCLGALFWAVSTVIDVVVTLFYIKGQHFNVAFSDWIPARSVLLNLLAYVMWAAFGIGLGTLLRNQIAAVVTGMALYLVGSAAAALVANLVYQIYPHAWVLGTPVVAPAVASLVMVTPGGAFEHAPPHWVGFAIMAGYTLVFSLSGIVASRRRDIT
jgi:ABC-2 type transport system permease protein